LLNTAIDTITSGGTHETSWGPDPFGIAKTGISWFIGMATRFRTGSGR
jgi:hypothetical protein